MESERLIIGEIVEVDRKYAARCAIAQVKTGTSHFYELQDGVEEEAIKAMGLKAKITLFYDGKAGTANERITKVELVKPTREK